MLIGLVDQGISGVLVRGSHGSGKSALLGNIRRLARVPVVEVPVGTTLENLLGSIDLGMMLKEGREARRSGLLERASGGILMIDDISCLPEETAAEILSGPLSGGYRVFACSGVDPGSPRPAVADRFDLAVTMEPLATAEDRLGALRAHFSRSSSETAIESLLEGSRAHLERIRMPSWLVPAAAVAAASLKLDGHRGETALVRASLALAALRREPAADERHLIGVAPLAFCHRTRNCGLEAPPSAKEAAAAVRSAVSAVRDGLKTTRQIDIDEMAARIMEAARNAFSTAPSGSGPGSARVGLLDPVPPSGGFPPGLSRKLETAILRYSTRNGSRRVGTVGRKAGVSRESASGRQYRIAPVEAACEMDLLQTARLAVRRGMRPPLLPMPSEYWRRWERHQRPSAVAILVVDASRSSSGYLAGLGATVESMFERVLDGYSRIGLVTIESGKPVLVSAPTRNRLRVLGKLGELSPSGATPLAEALLLAGRELEKAGRAGPARGFVLLVSDCYPEPFPPGDPWGSSAYEAARNAGAFLGRMGFPIVVIDPMSSTADYIEKSPGRRLGRYLASVSGGDLVPIPAMKMPNHARSIADILRASRREPGDRRTLDEASAALFETLQRLSGM
ncbi:MAG: VWA domain-containing protein [Candidatus Fermentibacter sp.]|nr:VWA domain-containing protein [Candidatus Fermentibacter sp.]